jgi:hypothetical protein
MTDGDVLVDSEQSFPDGTRVRIFAVESSKYPGGVNYRFQYYDPVTGDEFLRYDNSRVETHGAGHHHRHEWTEEREQVTEIDFVDLETHLARFRNELHELR